MVFMESKVALDLVQVFVSNVSAIVSARGASHRAQCSNHMRQIVIAMHLYAEKHGTLPPAVVYDDMGKPMHSWRVLLLPHLDQQNLFDRYNFNEPWDGPNNRKLVDEMPDVFRCPVGEHAAGETEYAVMVGEHTPFPPGSKTGRRLDQFVNGTSNTVLLSEISASSELAIPWTKPQDVALTEESLEPGSPKGFSSPHENGFNAAYADGSVRFIPLDIDRDQWKKSLRAD
jgi:prepilin-type processing-associated H-X9-DG protein